MKTFSKSWSIGLLVISIWISITFSVSAFWSTQDSGILYITIYCLLGIGIVVGAIFGFFKTIERIPQNSPKAAFALKLLFVLLTANQAYFRIRSALIQYPDDLESKAISFAIYSTLALIIVSILIDWYVFSKNKK